MFLFQRLSWRFSESLQGFKHIVAKSRCTVSLAPHWNSQNIEVTEFVAEQEVATTALIKLAINVSGTGSEHFSTLKDRLSTQQRSPWGDQNIRSVQNTETSQAIRISAQMKG